MRILFLASGPLGDAVRPVLRAGADEVTEVSDLDGLRYAVAEERVDWFVSAGFRHIVPPDLLQRASRTVNVHTSLLPYGRGAAPNVWAIVDGEPAGVTLHVMDPGVDTGAVYAQRAVESYAYDTGATLYARLIEAAGELFRTAWADIRSGQLEPSPQSGDGSEHRVSDLTELAAIDLDETVTWQRAIDTLRALTFPPHRNVMLRDGETTFAVQLHIEVVED